MDATGTAALCDIASNYGRGEIRSTVRHELEIPFVRESDVEVVLRVLHNLRLRTEALEARPNVVACPGADYCASALVKTGKLAHDLEAFLNAASDAHRLPPELRVALSGCPNECSHPHLNDVGFVGTAGAYAGHKVRGFELVVGGSARGDGRLAERIAFLSPEDVVPTLRDLVEVYRDTAAEGSRFAEFFFDTGAEELSRLLQKKLGQRMWFFEI